MKNLKEQSKNDTVNDYTCEYGFKHNYYNNSRLLQSIQEGLSEHKSGKLKQYTNTQDFMKDLMNNEDN